MIIPVQRRMHMVAIQEVMTKIGNVIIVIFNIF
jgi:hypothetical protein